MSNSAMKDGSSNVSFSAQTLALFEKEVAKYPPERRQAAVIACLTLVQQEHGHVSSDSELWLAHYLGMPAIAVHDDVETNVEIGSHQTQIARPRHNGCDGNAVVQF